jgi:hypothetical protein
MAKHFSGKDMVKNHAKVPVKEANCLRSRLSQELVEPSRRPEVPGPMRLRNRGEGDPFFRQVINNCQGSTLLSRQGIILK